MNWKVAEKAVKFCCCAKQRAIVDNNIVVEGGDEVDEGCVFDEGHF